MQFAASGAGNLVCDKIVDTRKHGWEGGREGVLSGPVWILNIEVKDSFS
jgi:hypothetical protein